MKKRDDGLALVIPGQLLMKEASVNVEGYCFDGAQRFRADTGSKGKERNVSFRQRDHAITVGDDGPPCRDQDDLDEREGNGRYRGTVYSTMDPECCTSHNDFAPRVSPMSSI